MLFKGKKNIVRVGIIWYKSELSILVKIILSILWEEYIRVVVVILIVMFIYILL